MAQRHKNQQDVVGKFISNMDTKEYSNVCEHITKLVSESDNLITMGGEMLKRKILGDSYAKRLLAKTSLQV